MRDVAGLMKRSPNDKSIEKLGDCALSQKTCFDPVDKKLYIRSRLSNESERKWITNTNQTWGQSLGGLLSIKKNKAQSILEFSAGMVVLCLIIYGMVETFRWGMMDMAERRFDNEKTLSDGSLNAEQQLNPDFHQMRPMDTLWYKKTTP
jgi:hypothetical protein